jgi:wyosine [tRNA(Phe)-imidazoG37] synthetase (radical SAM superfamily)
MPHLQVNSINGFHIEPTNMCTLKCAGCARTRFIQQWPSHWKNYNIDPDALFKFLDIDLTGKTFMLCGTYGDPIYYPKLIELVKGIKQRGAFVKINTNGSYQKTEWWQELCELLAAQDQIVFSIDGIPENFTQYRVNADWESIKKGLDVCVASSCSTVWKYIVFKYNQHDIESAKELSTKIGVDIFKVEYSDRFDNDTEYLKPDQSMLGSKYQSKFNFKNNMLIDKIDPACKNNQEHYISAEGFYMPCCFIGDHRFYYKTHFGKERKHHSIYTTTLTEILARPTTLQFYNNLSEQSVCQFNCPSN